MNALELQAVMKDLLHRSRTMSAARSFNDTALTYEVRICILIPLQSGQVQSPEARHKSLLDENESRLQLVNMVFSPSVPEDSATASSLTSAHSG